MGDTRTLVRRLLEHPEEAPPGLCADILACGAEAVEPLLELLHEQGRVPIHAVELLARLKPPEALVPLVRLLRHTGPGVVFHDALLFGLEEWGEAVVPVVLEELATTRKPDERLGLLSVLSRSGGKDERILQALLAQLPESPVQGALNLSRFGDPRAIEPLKRALDAYPLAEAEDLFANQAIVEMQLAIEDLGGSLDASHGEKTERARGSLLWIGSLFRVLLEELQARYERKSSPGRNDPCWCGSGEKYLRCHQGRESR